MDFLIAPIHSLGSRGFDDRFDDSRLPFHVSHGINIERVSDLFDRAELGGWERDLSESQREDLRRLRYGLIHRFNRGTENPNDSSSPVRLISSCLRLIRPMRTGVVD